MAPGTRRANRAGFVEHDDFEGLPVRQWRQENAQVAAPPPPEVVQKSDIWARELFWGMPRDAGLLVQHSQDLLRAARAGRLYKRAAPEEDEADADAGADKSEKKDEEASVKGFPVKVWKQVDRNSEGAGVSHLAKRRKGIVTISSKTVTTPPTGATITRATVKRVDAAGNPYTQEITLQQGQHVEGEIISTTVVAAPVPGEQPVATPPRARRPPPPKKNKKLGGPGRGRKKKMVPPPAPAPGQAGAVNGAVAGEVKTEDATNGESVWQSPSMRSTQLVNIANILQGAKLDREESNNPDSEMADNDNDDEEGDDDDDEGEEGEGEGEGEGEDGDDKKTEDNTEDQDLEMTDASPSHAPQETANVASASPDPQPLPVNPLLSASLNPALSASPKLEGSPLKNVLIPSPTAGSPNADVEPADVPELPPTEPMTTSQQPPENTTAPEAQPVASDTQNATGEPASVPEAEVEIKEAATFIPPPERVGNISSPEPTTDIVMGEDEEVKPQPEVVEEKPSATTPQESVPATEKPSKTPAIEEVTDNAEEVADVQPTAVEEAPAESPTTDSKVEEPPKAESETEQPADAPVEETSEPVEVSEPVTAPAEQDEGPDLLAGLETALDRQAEADVEKSADPTPAAEPRAPEVKEGSAEKAEEVKLETGSESAVEQAPSAEANTDDAKPAATP